MKFSFARSALLAATLVGGWFVSPTQAQNLIIDGTTVNLNTGGPYNYGEVRVGDRFPNSFLTVSNGSHLANNGGSIGYAFGSAGTATVTGLNSKWTNNQTLYVGNFGNGTLIVEQGAKLNSFWHGFVGTQDNSIGIATVTGVGSSWTINQNLNLGLQNNSNGTLNIESGGHVSNLHGYIGTYQTSSGTATITGSGSTWTNFGELNIGYFHNSRGTLNIEDGGQVSNTFGYIGRESHSINTATVSGENSKWTNSQGLFVGYEGNGTLNIENGGLVSNTYGYIGLYSGSIGAVTVNDATWNNSQYLHVGHSGNGTLHIQTGGEVSNTTGYIARFSGTGIATVSGLDATWTNSGNLYIGGWESASGGTGSLTVTNGGHVDVAGTLKLWNAGTITLDGGSITTGSLDRTLGTFNHHDGTFTVDGGTYSQPSGFFITDANAAGKNAHFVLDNGATTSGVTQVRVGNNQQGTLTVDNGSVLSNSGVAYIGTNVGSTGTATVRDNATWNNSSDLYVGNAGNGTLDILEGGHVSNNHGTIGNAIGTVGVATVNDATWTNSGHLNVGYNGDGTLKIQNGGQVSNVTGYIGRNVDSSGSATVTGGGSLWANTGFVSVGYDGDGTLNIENGGEVTNTYGIVGYASTSTGVATITGPGSKWTNSEGAYIGVDGNGTLNIQNGGQLTNTSGYIGQQTGSTGTVTVTGDDSKWTNNLDLFVGYNGNGTLNIENGGLVTNISGYIGTHISGGVKSTGIVTVNDATWNNSHSLLVGNAGNGTLNIQNGGLVSNLWGFIGLQSGLSGTVTVNDATWNNSENLYVGEQGNGTLNIQTGGQVSNRIGHIGYSSGSTGTATVSGLDANWINSGNLYVGGWEAAAGGTGSLSVTNAGHVDVAGTLKLWNAGTVTLDGGSITTRSLDRTLGTFNHHDGTFTVDGGTYSHAGGNFTINGNAAGKNPHFVLDNGATTSGVTQVWVGNNQQGTLTVKGVSTLANSGIAFIGTNVDSTGAVTVNDATWNNGSNLLVGRSGNGTLHIENGGLVSNTNGFIGASSSSTGTVTVNDATWTNSGVLSVGDQGNGTLHIQTGGEVSNTTGYIARYSGSSGTTTVSGLDANWTNSGNLYVGGQESGAGGTGSLTVTNAGLVTVGQNAKVWSTGSVDVQSAGTVSVTGNLDNAGLIEIASGGTVTAASITNTGSMTNHGQLNGDILTHNGGILTGTGAFNGVVTIGDGGFFSAGASPGTASMTDTIWDANGTYTWEINALAGYGGSEGNDPGWDLWNTGDLTIDGPFNIALTTLDANSDAGLLANWDAMGAYQWRIATATNGAFGDLSELFFNFTGFQNVFDANFFSLTASGDGNDLYLNYINADASTVPEPGSVLAMLSLVACGAGAVVRRRRRAKKMEA